MPNSIHSALDRAIDTFVRDMVGLFSEATTRALAAQPGNPVTVTTRSEPVRVPRRAPRRTAPPKAPEAPSAPPVPAVKPSLPRNLVPLRRGTDIHTIASRARPFEQPVQPLPAFLRALEPERPKGPTPEQLGERVVGMLWAADGPMVFERIRLALATKKDVLTPVLDRLLSENRISSIEVDGVTAYKPPRIEPIRRRRPAEA
jgi:hypothetical protein